MEVFMSVGSQLMVLFILMLVGAVARKIGLLTDNGEKALSGIVMKITLPAMILSSVLSNTDMPDMPTVIGMFWLGFGSFAWSCLLAFVVVFTCFRGASLASKGAYAFVVAFCNPGFIGFPLVCALLGNNALLLASVFNIANNLFLFSAGMLFLAKTGSNKSKKSVGQEIKGILRELCSPVMASCVLAMILALLQITDQGPISVTCNTLGQATVPLALMMVGSSLAKQDIKAMIGDGWVYVTCVLSLIVVPLGVWFVGGLFIANTYMLAIATLLMATPAATIGVIMAMQYGGDVEAVARSTFMTTLLSLVSIPCIAMIIM